MSNMSLDAMGLPLKVGSKVINSSSSWSFKDFREKGRYWVVTGFTPKMVRIEPDFTSKNEVHKKTVYAVELMSLEPYTLNYPELFL